MAFLIMTAHWISEILLFLSTNIHQYFQIPSTTEHSLKIVLLVSFLH